MGADFEFSIDSSGKPQLFFIDKGNSNINVGSRLSDFIVEKELGKGNFGAVYLAKFPKYKKAILFNINIVTKIPISDNNCPKTCIKSLNNVAKLLVSLVIL